MRRCVLPPCPSRQSCNSLRRFSFWKLVELKFSVQSVNQSGLFSSYQLALSMLLHWLIYRADRPNFWRDFYELTNLWSPVSTLIMNCLVSVMTLNYPSSAMTLNYPSSGMTLKQLLARNLGEGHHQLSYGTIGESFGNSSKAENAAGLSFRLI